MSPTPMEEENHRFSTFTKGCTFSLLEGRNLKNLGTPLRWNGEGDFKHFMGHLMLKTH